MQTLQPKEDPKKRFDLYLRRSVKPPAKIKHKNHSYFMVSPLISPRTIRIENLSPDSFCSEEQHAVFPKAVSKGLATSRNRSPQSKMEQLLGSKRNCRIFKC